MASLMSFGLHEPSALTYCVDEGLLSPDPPASSYKWAYQQSRGCVQNVTDEILQTTSCVIWSRSGIVKRVFNLDIEGESIVNAFTTSFRPQPASGGVSKNLDSVTETEDIALVVVLRTQVHIFLLSGDTHVFPLSFEVDHVVPAAHGFLLQRKRDPSHKNGILTSQSGASLADVSSVPASIAPERSALGGFASVKRIASPQLPRTFGYTQLLSELTSVVSGSLRKQSLVDEYPALSSDEDIVYTSTHDELQELKLTSSEHMYLAVTTNTQTRSLTFWRVLFNPTDEDDSGPKRETEKVNATSKRKSSNIYGRQVGAATPIIRGPGMFRESIGGLKQSIPESGMPISGRDRVPPLTDDLGLQLGHEFEQAGVQTRSARRVSSMLARTDLGAANDRSTFNDMATGTFSRKSFGRSLRRGESLGGFSDRQSFGPRRRSSFQAASSIYSDGTSFLDIPASHLLDDGAGQHGMDMLESSNSLSTTNRLSRDVVFVKLKSLPYEFASGGAKQPTLKVMTLLAPDRSTTDDRRSRIISVCVMDKDRQEMTIVNIAAKVILPTSKHKHDKVAYDLKAVEVQRAQSVVDACSIVEDYTKRLLILTQTREGQSVLHLDAPWTVSYRVDLPARFKVFDTFSINASDSPASRRETGIRRSITQSEVEIKSLQNCEFGEQTTFLDTQNRCHRLRFRLTPSQPLVRKILQLCNFVLAPEFFDSILVAWWEVKRWIESQGTEPDIEWTAMTITLFMLAIPFISGLQSQPAQGSKRKKGGMLRSSSGTTVDLSHWDAMQEIEDSSSSQLSTGLACWTWARTTARPKMEPKSPSKHARLTSSENVENINTDPSMIRYTNLARDFLQSPAGENATGPEGYLPTAVNKDRATRRTALASVLVGLHLLREELKLHEIGSSFSIKASTDLAVLIAQMASWLKWREWRMTPGQYYYFEVNDPAKWLIEPSVIDNLDVPPQPFKPPSIFEHIEDSILVRKETAFPSLLDLHSQGRPVSPGHPVWQEAARITPRLFATTALMAHLRQRRSPRSVIKHMTKCGIDGRILETLPTGIAAIGYQAIVTAKGQPQPDWSIEMKSLLGRIDLDADQKSKDLKISLSHISHIHDAPRDHHTISSNAIEADTISRWDSFSELDRQAITRLMFSEDRRFQEGSKFVNQTRPPTVECTPEPGWSEADFLDAQKELAVHVTRRTLSVSAGRAMMHFNARVPLLTERVPIPAFSLQCIMKSRGSGDDNQPMTLSADKALFTEDKVCWAFFHNGASAGLMISKDIGWIDTSWILYNKPPELTNRHAGFLLALGLNGHLKSLAKWVAFKYLTPKHTMTSIGLLLGLAASYIGTMDTLIARLLSVHVTCLLPIGAAELNLSPLTQTTGIIGVGLLYCNSQHRRMSEIMLSEIENSDSEDRSGDETILRDEGYRLAAGFSLGLINLGQGQKLHSLRDMNVVERLLTIAIGTKNVNLVHVLDRATAGAVIAVGFIYMKTNDEMVAQKIDIPDTVHQFDYVRPDIFLLRTLARHLIMWDSITPTQEFVRSSLPPMFRSRAHMSTTKSLSTDDLPFYNVIAGICFAMSLRFAGSHREDVRDLLVSYLDQLLRLSKIPGLNYDAKVTLNGVRNCLDLLALSCATVMAGSGDIIVLRRLRALHGRTDKETPFGSHLAAHMAIGMLFLSGGTATLGTSHVAVAALVISLYPLFPVDVLDNKAHLQALRHLWVLAVENRCLIAKDVETQQVVSDIEAELEMMNGTTRRLKSPGLLPAFDTIKKVNFRHKSYWPVSVDFDGSAKQGPKSAGHHGSRKTVPRSIREYLISAGAGLKVYLQRRVVYEKPDTDAFFSELQALDEARGVPSTDPNTGVNEKWRQMHSSGTTSEHVKSLNPFDWVFELKSLKHLGFAERSLVVGESGLSSSGAKDLFKGTGVDSVLELASSCLEANDDDDDDENEKRKQKFLHTGTTNKDRLWQLRLLFAWTDRWEAEEEEHIDNDEQSSVRWMKKQVVEQLRWKIWKLAGGEQE